MPMLLFLLWHFDAPQHAQFSPHDDINFFFFIITAAAIHSTAIIMIMTILAVFIQTHPR